jgi:UDP-sulfoquinovose synthase
VHDSHNLEFACRAWGLRVTDLNQGVVYGHETDQTVLHLDLATRLDYDAVFGTVLNRFAVQAAMGDPLTVYGEGGQTRGFINLRDVMQCIQLACDVEPLRGEFRVFNQFTETFSVRELALKVSRVAGTTWDIQHIDNPRIEQEHHYYNAKNSALLGLGLEPRVLNDDVIADLIEVAKRNLSRVDASKMRPTASWKAPDARI